MSLTMEPQTVETTPVVDTAQPDRDHHCGDLWSRWAPRLDEARMWDPPAVPTLVVAPHPDDEILGCGGLIATQRRRGVPVRVIAVTDGEAAYPDDVEPDVLATIRRAEQRAALAAVGVGPFDVVRLGIPDGEVGDHEPMLQRRLLEAGRGAGLLVAPWSHDHHSDHEAAGRAARLAARALGVPLAQTVFWGWQHADPTSFDGLDVVGIPLDPGARGMRRLGLAAHRSQTRAHAWDPILGPGDLEPLSWPCEYHLLDGGA